MLLRGDGRSLVVARTSGLPAWCLPLLIHVLGRWPGCLNLASQHGVLVGLEGEPGLLTLALGRFARAGRPILRFLGLVECRQQRLGVVGVGANLAAGLGQQRQRALLGVQLKYKQFRQNRLILYSKSKL